MRTSLTDTHCHIYDPAFQDDLEQVMQRARENGVDMFLLPNINPDTIGDMLRVCDTWPDLCRPMIGLHPEDLDSDFHSQLSGLKALLDADRSDGGAHRYIGIGETGLDLHWDQTRLDDQIESFSTQIGWALEYDLPIVIHSRDSHEQLIDALEPYRNSALRGVFHCFSGTAEQAAALLEFSGFMLGIGGVLTYRKSGLPEVLKVIPKDRIVLETDCPYLPPVPHRGKRNEPSFILHTAQFLAQVWECSLEQVAAVTGSNAARLFRL